MVHIGELTLAALLLAAPASALYHKSGPVKLLDSKTFDTDILQSDNAAVSILRFPILAQLRANWNVIADRRVCCADYPWLIRNNC